MEDSQDSPSVLTLRGCGIHSVPRVDQGKRLGIVCLDLSVNSVKKVDIDSSEGMHSVEFE